ncbi:MAG: hypothetical protein QW318_07945 [Candidatus Caldarchaeum sp.]
MSRFAAIPLVPTGTVPEPVFRLLVAMKENIDILTGTGPTGRSQRAVLKSDFSLPPISGRLNYSMNARGAGVSFSGVQVPVLEDYAKLLQDVQNLSIIVAEQQAYIARLVEELRK